METNKKDALGERHGDEGFPVEWREGEKELFWILDDLHCPNPVSPMFFDIGGWWLTCDHMFRRFGTPFASDWIAKRVNGYLYTAAIPASPDAKADGAEYNARYVPRVPERAEYAGEIGAYLGGVLPSYAYNFLDWWRDRLRPEMDRNFAYLDGYDTENATLTDLAILLEDAIDIHDRHWKIHWMLNFSQFSATIGLNTAIGEIKGDADPGLPGRLQSSTADLNWDAVADLWEMKEAVKGDEELSRIFRENSTPSELREGLEDSDAGRGFIADKLEPHQRTFGYKAIWSHEFAFPTWVENPAPILEAVRGYIETDYDYPAAIQGVKDDLEAAKAELMEGVEGEDRECLQGALDLSLRMNPLTPDHHFYIDQGTNARLRLVLIAIGKKLVAADLLDDAEDIMFLHYNELRVLMFAPDSMDAREVVSDRRDEQEDAYEIRPPEWLGTATEEALAFPYAALWGFPEKFYRKPSEKADEVVGLGASSGVIEGTAKVVLSLEEADQVEKGDILVCKMTNPAWVVLFTKVGGLVTDAGGTTSHPAVVSREFGIPAVVGTSVATQKIKSGDTVRVNGATGMVEILA